MIWYLDSRLRASEGDNEGTGSSTGLSTLASTGLIDLQIHVQGWSKWLKGGESSSLLQLWDTFDVDTRHHDTCPSNKQSSEQSRSMHICHVPFIADVQSYKMCKPRVHQTTRVKYQSNTTLLDAMLLDKDEARLHKIMKYIANMQHDSSGGVSVWHDITPFSHEIGYTGSSTNEAWRQHCMLYCWDSLEMCLYLAYFIRTVFFLNPINRKIHRKVESNCNIILVHLSAGTLQ